MAATFFFPSPRPGACTMERVAANGRGPPPPPEDAPCGTRCSQWAFRSCYRCLTMPTAGFFTQWAVYCSHNKKGEASGFVLCMTGSVNELSSVFPVVTRCRLLVQFFFFFFLWFLLKLEVTKSPCFLKAYFVSTTYIDMKLPCITQGLNSKGAASDC